jgi:nucleoside-diphosphate-sugar epimerase
VEARHETAVLVRKASRLDELSPIRERIAIFRIGEGCSGLPEMLKEVKPDVVFHVATYFVVQHSPPDIEPLVEANILFPCKLLEAMCSAGVRYLVNTGTSWQHFQCDAYRPVGLHAATKQAFEDLLEFYTDAERLSAITLKLYDTYGPDDPRRKVFNFLLRQLEQTDLLVMSPGGQKLDMVHVNDVVAAYLMAAERLLSGKVASAEAYAVSSGQPVSLREIVECFEAAVGYRINIQWGGRPYREREVMTTWTGGKVLPGWAPRIDLASGFRMMAEHYGKGVRR